MRIGELATRTGVSVRSLRYYEEQGLLSSVRSASGQRHYREEQVERVAFLQRLYTAGLSSRTISELLPCVDAPSAAATDAALGRMAEERGRLSAHIAELVATRDALDRLVELAHLHRSTQPAPAPGCPLGDADPDADADTDADPRTGTETGTETGSGTGSGTEPTTGPAAESATEGAEPGVPAGRGRHNALA